MTDEAFDDDRDDGIEQYSIVANRRQQWDTLLWQMPTMALTGEAFLFTISLGGSTSQTGRIVASLLALVVAVASLHSLSAHRLSELTDARWLHEHEARFGGSNVHGLSWRDRRMETVQSQLVGGHLTDDSSRGPTRSARSRCGSGRWSSSPPPRSPSSGSPSSTRDSSVADQSSRSG